MSSSVTHEIHGNSAVRDAGTPAAMNASYRRLGAPFEHPDLPHR